MSEEGNEKNPFKKERKTEEWPEEVSMRFKMQAERTGESVDKVAEAFIKHISETWECDDWKAEDEDVLVDWAEMMFVEDRSSNISGGGGQSTTFVGQWLGVEDKTVDRNAWNVRNATSKWNENSNEAISDGVVGHYYKEEGLWVINTANGAVVTNETTDEAPSLGFKVGDDWLCLMSRAGRPYPAERLGRYYRFLGNEKNSYMNDIRKWRVDLTGENRNLKIDIGVPVQIQVRLPTTQNEAFQDVLGTNYDFADTMQYTDEWAPESVRAVINDPFKMWTNSDYVDDMAVRLTELEEAYHEGKRTFTGRDGNDGTVGPEIIIRGTVTRMSTEGRESEWDETGRSYSLNLTSMMLSNEHGNGKKGEVPCWISGACNEIAHPFQFRDVDEELWGYGQKSQVLVFGRLRLKLQDGETQPQMSVMGVYTQAGRAHRQVGGGDTASTQFD